MQADTLQGIWAAMGTAMYMGEGKTIPAPLLQLQSLTCRIFPVE